MIEIERKFLVVSEPDLSGATPAKIRQGYVTGPGDSVSVRLRQKGDKFLMSVKSGQGVVRQEHETQIQREQFDTLWPATDGRRLGKVRWTGPLPDGKFYELDHFEGDHAPLRLVEVEFASLADARAFQPPDWFGREVTGDRRYSNSVMALEGTPTAETVK